MIYTKQDKHCGNAVDSVDVCSTFWRMPPKTEKLLTELKEWCDEKYGRRAEFARAIGTTRGAITHWFAGRQQPTAEQVLEVLEFLKKHRRKK
jgi:hypothetical protein